VALTVWRGGKEQKLDVKVDQLPEPELKTASLKGKRNADQASALGLAVRPLDPAEKQQIETEGTLVVDGQVTGPALAAGVQQGDIILAVNGKKVKTIADLNAAAKTAGKTVALLIQRGDGGIFFLPLRLS
jgi:serine protease Do